MRLTRLSPKSLFFGMVVLGLPFAVTVGWALGGPAATTTTTPPPATAPAGAGVIGAAPSPTGTAAPVTVVDYTHRSSRTPARPSASAAGLTAAGPSASASASALPPPLPTLTDPPVPTPTSGVSEPPAPSATPSASASPEPTRFGLIRR